MPTGGAGMKDILQIHPKDNGAVCLAPQGEIPAGHKIALCAIEKGEAVIKYGHRIGTAVCAIGKGAWVHTHNLATALTNQAAYAHTPVVQPLPAAPAR